MPLYKIINHNPTTQILIWKITETFSELFETLNLTPQSLQRLANMKSEQHQKGFLSIRKLLQETAHEDSDLYYDAFGKPHLKNEIHISITHSFDFSAIVLSDKKIGIDIELRREKIKIIAKKFITSEIDFIQNNDDQINKLTVIWGAKEAIFKIQNEKGISFKDHIVVAPFQMQGHTTKALLNFDNHNKLFAVFFEEIENFTLVYALENH